MIRTYKYRAYINKKTESNAIAWLDNCRYLYNCALRERIDAYHDHKISLSFYDQQSELPELKIEYPELNIVGAQTFQDVLRKLDKAYKKFFRRIKNGEKNVGFPRFKGKNRINSFTLTQNNWKLEGNTLIITKVGRFKLRLSRKIDGKIKSITVKRTPTKKWYVCFSCDEVTKKELPKNNNIVGIDVGIASYLADSEGNKIKNPKYLKNSLMELRIKQRKLSRAKKGSNRRNKTKLQFAKCYEKISNQRNDFLHKLSTEYIKKYGIIKFENLNIGGMVKNGRLSREINDCSWGKFFDLLSYKAEEAGRDIVKVNPKNTSKKCHKCGAINHVLKLSDRIWICENCGTTHDRDENAAQNIKVSEVRAEPSVANVSGCTKRRLKSIKSCGVKSV